MGRPAKYPAEFREAAVEMVRSTDKPIAEIARDLGINDGRSGTGSALTAKLAVKSPRSC